MNKIRIIIARECKLALTAWPFWLVTLGLPLMLVTIGGITLLIGISTGKSIKSSTKNSVPPVLGIVDHANLMDWESLNETETGKPETPTEITSLMESVNLPPTLEKRMIEMMSPIARRARALDYKVFEDVAAAKAALTQRRLLGFLEIPADYETTLQTKLTVYDQQTRIGMSMVENDLRNYQLARQLDEAQVAKISKPLGGMQKEAFNQSTGDEAEQNKAGDSFGELKKFVLPIGFMMMFVFVIITSTDRLMRGLVEEKTNRVIEILLSSTTSDQLMAGKVLGLGLVGLIQLSIWLIIALLPLSWLLAFIDFPVMTFLVFVLFFLLGYFMFASMVLGLGSLGKDLQEANQWLGLLVVLTVLPMSMIPGLVEHPDGMLAQFFTWFPLTSPLVVVLRFGAGAISGIEIFGALVVLALANVVVIKISARIFRIGILMTGKTPNPLEVWRALKHS